MKIRDFVYLDSGRMYSLYSQVFEGIAEHVANTSINRHSTDNTVKKFASGDNSHTAAEETLMEIENKIMFDNLYSRLEDKLLPNIKIINDEIKNLCIDEVKDVFILKIVGQAFIHDYTRLADFMDKYNRLGDIIAQSIFDNLSIIAKKNTSVKDIIKNRMLNLEKANLSNLKFVSEFFNNNCFEVMIVPNIVNSEIVFKGILNREFLRIDENRLRHLYSNQPSMPWVMVGQLTYAPQKAELAIDAEEKGAENKDIVDKDEKDKGVKNENEKNELPEYSVSDSYVNLINASTNVEAVFSESKMFTKVHIAPIAIYVEQDLNI